MSVALELRGRDRDLGGGFRVNRLLPAAALLASAWTLRPRAPMERLPVD
jgi:hypothetical protein